MSYKIPTEDALLRMVLDDQQRPAAPGRKAYAKRLADLLGNTERSRLVEGLSAVAAAPTPSSNRRATVMYRILRAVIDGEPPTYRQVADVVGCNGMASNAELDECKAEVSDLVGVFWRRFRR